MEGECEEWREGRREDGGGVRRRVEEKNGRL